MALIDVWRPETPGRSALITQVTSSFFDVLRGTVQNDESAKTSFDIDILMMDNGTWKCPRFPEDKIRGKSWESSVEAVHFYL